MVMVSLESSKTQTKTEVGTKDWGIVVIDLTMILFGGMWTLGVQIRKAVESFKWGLMGHPSRSLKDSGAEDDLNCGDLDLEVSEENICMWPRECSCVILAKDMATFSPCL